MSAVKNKISTHLKAAQRWLGKAEKSFDDDCDWRGELDLMLAKAEFQHISELRYTKSRNYKKKLYLILAGIMVFSSVFFHTKLIVEGDFTGKGVLSSKVIEEPIVEAKVKNDLNEVSGVESNGISTKIIHPTVEMPVSPVVKKDNIVKKDEGNIVNSHEMQKIMREAGQSLRGEDVKRSE